MSQRCLDLTSSHASDTRFRCINYTVLTEFLRNNVKTYFRQINSNDATNLLHSVYSS